MTPAQMLTRLRAVPKECERPDRLKDVLDAAANKTLRLEPCDHCGLYMGHTTWCTIGRAEVSAYGPVIITDYAKGVCKTYSECLEARLCPVCGAHTHMELDMTDQSKEMHWCQKNSGHAFEYDKEHKSVDRVPL